eukprot:Em0003g1154a
MPKGVTICNVKPKLKKESGSMEHQEYTELASLLFEFGELFAEESGTIVGDKAVVHLKEEAVPKLYSVRPIPFPMKKAVEDELNRLVKQDILEIVDTTKNPIEWASPLVCVPKSSGGVRLCVDFRVTINPHVYVDPHPLPRFEDIIAKLSGSKTFSVVDHTDAYLQMEVDPSSRKFMVVATHKGYFQYKRLPFGVNFASAIFQKTMEIFLAGIDKVAVYIDDITVEGSSKEEHIHILREVFVRLRDANVRAKKSKDTLVHYREELPLILETDASDRGVGAVLLHQLPDKSERPVAFASRTFLDCEKNYSVIDKEALAIIFSVTKFYQYVYGRKFTLRTDHKPLEHILGANQEIPKMAANRLQSWNVPTEPWQRIHIDYAGPFEGSSWLVVVDAFSKWIEIKSQRSTTTSGTVKLYERSFTERAVRTFKEKFLASQGSTDDVELRLQRFLLSYRNTPHKSTGRAPAIMLMGRKLRTKLDLLKPDPLSYMDQAVVKQKLYHDQGAKLRIFRDGDEVWVQRPTSKRYDEGIIVRRTGDVSYLVETGGQVKRKHADQLRTKMAISEELMHNDPARVNCRQALDVDATHTETQGTKRGDEGSHQVPHRSPEVLQEGADGCQGFQTSEVPGVPTISNERVQDEQTHKTYGSTHTQEEQEEPTLPTVSSGSVQQKERPKRDQRPPSRPYDKYLSNPRAK